MTIIINYELRKIFINHSSESILDIELKEDPFIGFEEYVEFTEGYDSLDRELTYDLHYSISKDPLEETINLYKKVNEDTYDETFPEIIRIGTLEKLLTELR